MFIGHLPAGYLLARALRPAFDEDRLVFWAVIAGSVLPDLDMFWFYLVDGGGVHHHSYLTHDPTLWIAVLSIGFVATSRLLIGLGVGGLLHMILDTIVGAINWGYGRLSVSGPIIEVPATQDWWVMSFVLHWTFLIELTVVALALRALVLDRRTA